MGNADSPALDDGKRPRIDGWCRNDDLVCPYDGLDELLPVATAGEQEHQRERPDEVGTQEHQTIRRTWRAVRLDDL